MFFGGLLLSFIVNLALFIAAGVYVNGIDDAIDADWPDINATLNTFGKDNYITKQEFVADAKSGLRFIVATGAILSVCQQLVGYCNILLKLFLDIVQSYLLIGMLSSAYIFTRRNDILSQAEKILQTHANDYLDSVCFFEYSCIQALI